MLEEVTEFLAQLDFRNQKYHTKTNKSYKSTNVSVAVVDPIGNISRNPIKSNCFNWTLVIV